MTAWLGALILAGVLATATLSGVFGMAGGLILMGLLTALLPVPAALAIHGLVQMASNASRILLHLKHVVWRVVGFYAIGAVATMGAFLFISYAPPRPSCTWRWASYRSWSGCRRGTSPRRRPAPTRCWRGSSPPPWR
uniref:Probable membrane transporter protein n=1 Tax=Phenylobacterium glaciei TaxID=2803784 RepID=A0A974S862_9CAUL|nr:sulfite exporter TauE/SafE family protein [Phenylobacterium glaciei]